MSTDSTQIDQLKQMDQLLKEIDALYQQPWYSMKGPEETKDAYRNAFKEIADVFARLRRELQGVYGAIDWQPGVDTEVRNVISHLRVHKDWVTFMSRLEGVVFTELDGGSMYIYLANGLLQEVDPDTAELYSMQPREVEDDPNRDRASLSDEQDRDVLYMPAPRA